MSNAGPHSRCGTAIPGLDHFLAVHSSTMRRLEEDRDGIGNLQAVGTWGCLAPGFAMCPNSPTTFGNLHLSRARHAHLFLDERNACSRRQTAPHLSCDFIVLFCGLVTRVGTDHTVPVDVWPARNLDPSRRPRECLWLHSLRLRLIDKYDCIRHHDRMWYPSAKLLFDALHRGNDTPAQSCIGRMNPSDHLFRPPTRSLSNHRIHVTHVYYSGCPTLAHLSKLPTASRAVHG